MYCTCCGKEIPVDSKFCTSCGNKLGPRNDSKPEVSGIIWKGKIPEQATLTTAAAPSQPVPPKPKFEKCAGIGVIGVIAALIAAVLAVIFLIMSTDVIADTKTLKFDEISSEELGSAVENYFGEVDWSYEKVEDNHYEVAFKGFSPDLMSNIEVTLDVFYAKDKVYGSFSSVVCDNELYTDDESLSAIACLIFGVPVPSNDIVLETEFFDLTLPGDWDGRYLSEKTDAGRGGGYWITLYETQSYDDGYGGILVSIGAIQEPIDDYPDAQFLGELGVNPEGIFNVFAIFPTDVEFSEAGMNNYMDMKEDVEAILASFSLHAGREGKFTPTE